jgi:hypothetical protein
MLYNYKQELFKIAGLTDRLREAGISFIPGAIVGAGISGLNELRHEGEIGEKLKNVGKGALAGGLASGLMGMYNQNKKKINVDSPIYFASGDNIAQIPRTVEKEISMHGDNILKAIPVSLATSLMRKGSNDKNNGS